MGLTFDQLFPGRFIKAGEMQGKPATLTIKSVYLNDLERDDGTEKQQPIVSFEETKREWALNKTNALCLRTMWGDEINDWVGKRVTLYPEQDDSGLAESGVCLRVKGSPDIDGDMEATIKLHKRRPRKRTLVKTKAKGNQEEDVGEFWPSEEE